jgi:predicted helicase
LKALAKTLNARQQRAHALPQGIAPEDIFDYAYAVFHSPTYRTRYAEFLKIDFPRLPLTSNLKLFRALAAKGAELVALHLLESPKVEDFLTDWPVKGDNIVEKVQYTEKDHRVWINKTQYFGGVPKPVWDFHIGGYQVCHKWLKDRKGRRLTYEDTQHYQKVVVALSETIRLMAEIDEVIGQHGGWPMK